MSDFHFLRPFVLLLLIPLLFWIFRKRKSASIWNGICSEDLLPYMIGKKNRTSQIPYYLFGLTGALLIIALAGPTWKLQPQPLFKTQSGLVIALDLSPSMNAEDVKPTRLKRAIYKITDILEARKEGQTALLVYSEDPYVVTPLTDDIKTIKAMLPVLETNIMPSVGHRTEKAVAKGAELLEQAGILNGSVLLVTAEITNKELKESLSIAEKKNLSLAVLGVGTEQGAPIPKKEGGFMKDEKGAMVLSMLSKENLSKMGTYVTISSDGSDVEVLSRGFSEAGRSKEETELLTEKWHDAGYWLVIAALPFAALFFRRGIIGGLFVLFVVPIHGGLWKSSEKEAEELFHEGKYEEAGCLFKCADWKGAVSYRLGDYERAVEFYQENQTADGFYNLGNAKAKMGDYEGALVAYKKALEIEPEHEDALYNKKLIEEMKQDKQDNEQDKQENEKQQDKEEEKEQDSQDSQDKEDKEEEKEQAENDEQREMDDRWLQKVPDDPGGLLRRKFLQQYRYRKGME